MESPDVKLLLSETGAVQDALLHEEEDISQQGLVSQRFVCLRELNQGYRTNANSPSINS